MTGRRAKLVCTLGPASASPVTVRALAEAGADVFRVNLSHGIPEDHAELVRLVRDVEEDLEVDLGVMADLPGPKVRLGSLAREPVSLMAGASFVLRAEGGPGDETGATTTYPELARDVRPGDRLLVADGAVELTVRGVEERNIVTECVRAGRIRAGAGINVPAERLGLPSVTDRDRAALATALDLGADLVAQSFVRRAADVRELRALMGDRPVPVIAKIETRPAVEAIAAILDEADGVMVARGDLGVELPMEEIPVLQKEVLREARLRGRPSIVATQMLESMIHAPRPTRAEVGDVANAVLDGTDAVLLSGETAIGEYPVEAALAAVRIAQTAEERGRAFRAAATPCLHTFEAAAVAHAAAQLAASDEAVDAIVCYTMTGRTAGLLSAERPVVPIFAFVPVAQVRRALRIRWGVFPLPAEIPPDTDRMISVMDRGLREAGVVPQGASVVMTASLPAGRTTTNMLKVHQVGARSVSPAV